MRGIVIVTVGVVAVVVALSGCFANLRATEGAAPIALPPDFDGGEGMLAYSGFRAHSADEEQHLVRADDSQLARPAFCGAYQDGVRKAGDDCTVEDADTRWGEYWGPWTINASWDGAGEDLVETERNLQRRVVVAFSQDGQAVAWWAGARHADGSMAVE